MTLEASLNRIADALERLLTGAALAVPPAETGPTVAGSATLPSQAPPSAAPKPPKAPKAPKAPEAPATPPTAPVTPVAVPAPAPATPPLADTAPTPQAPVTKAADAILALANDFPGGRDLALAIMAQRGVSRVAELKPDQLQGVIEDATVAYAAQKAKQANSALI